LISLGDSILLGSARIIIILISCAALQDGAGLTVELTAKARVDIADALEIGLL